MWTLAVSYVTNMQDLGVPAGKISCKSLHYSLNTVSLLKPKELQHSMAATMLHELTGDGRCEPEEGAVVRAGITQSPYTGLR